jgi:hypothetical protein
MAGTRPAVPICEAGLYNYFPFAFKVATNAPQAEIGEIEGPNQITELHLEDVAPDWRRLTVSFVSEQSGVPKNLSLGPDERDLALRLDAVSFRQRHSTLASAAAVQSSSISSHNRLTWLGDASHAEIRKAGLRLA